MLEQREWTSIQERIKQSRLVMSYTRVQEFITEYNRQKCLSVYSQ